MLDSRFVLLLTGWFLIFMIQGCAQGYCYNRGDNRTVSAPAITGKRVFVYQADGSKQCSKAPGESLEDMSVKLKDIKIYSKEKKSDGKMHIALCGSATGKINVYEIDESNLAKAKAAHFEELKNEL